MGDAASAAAMQSLPSLEVREALVRLAESLGHRPIPSNELCALQQLAQGEALTLERGRLAIAAMRAAIPCFSLAALHAAQALVNLLSRSPDAGAVASDARSVPASATIPVEPPSISHPLLAEAYLVLGQVHAARRAGRAALIALDAARR